MKDFYKKKITYRIGDVTNDWFLKNEAFYNYDTAGRNQSTVSVPYLNNTPKQGDTLFFKYHQYGSLDELTIVHTDSSYFEDTGRLYPFTEIQWDFKHDGDVTLDQVKVPRSYSPHSYQNHMLIEKNRRENLDPLDSQYGYGFLTTTSNAEYFYSELTTTSTEEIDNIQDIFTISPNPAADYIEITSSETIGELHLTMIDINGRQVINQKTNTNSRINIAHLPKGTYIYSVTDGTHRSTGKVFVH